MKLKLFIIITTLFSNTVFAQSESGHPWDTDGNTLGTTAFNVIKMFFASFELLVIVLVVLGGAMVVSGICLWISASKLQISPMMGIWTTLIGFVFCSPMGCSAMATNQLLNAPASTFNKLMDTENPPSPEDFIQPNGTR